MEGYSSSIVSLEVELPKKVMLFYRKRGKFVEDLPSYEHIEGKAIEPGNEAYSGMGAPIVLTYPLKYETEIQEGKAVEHSMSLIRNLYKSHERDSRSSQRVRKKTKRYALRKVEKSDIQILERNYMMNARTLPIQILSAINGEAKNFYVKKPSVARILGNELYNIIAGHEINTFVFNNTVFVENETKGELVLPPHADDEETRELMKESKNKILQSPKFRESAIKADVHDWFLSVNDMDNYRNFLVDENMEVKLIDFDNMFNRRNKEQTLIEFLKEEKADIPKKFYNVVAMQEKFEIRKRIVRNKKQFDNLIELFNHIPEYNHQVQAMFGVKDLEEYFDKRFSELI